jgi:hypothetical protein
MNLLSFLLVTFSYLGDKVITSNIGFYASIAQLYSTGLLAGRSGFYGSIPAGIGNFSLHHRVKNGPRSHPRFYPMCNRCVSPGGKAAGA